MRNAYTEPVDNWVGARPQSAPAELVEQATAVIDRVLASPSELLESWAEGDDPQQWQNAVSDLRARVTD